MNDESLNIEDLLENDSFISWVLEDKDASRWEEFLRLNPEKREVVEKASKIVLELRQAEREVVPAIDEHKLWQRIESSAEKREEPVRPKSGRKMFVTLLAAACVAVVAAFAIFQAMHSDHKRVTYKELLTHAKVENQLLEKQNQGQAPMEVRLEDGTVITLGKNSRLSYPAHFQKHKREVFLSGEAFFDVTKDPNRPFLVYANETVTKVLGTSFEIKAFENSQAVTVHVRTGRVSVYKQSRIQMDDPETTGLLLLPNQQGTFNRDSETLVKNLVPEPLPIEPITDTKKFRFDEVPVTEVLAEIEKMYGVQIVCDHELLAKCIISTTVRNESLYDNLDVICRTIGGSYKEIDAQIVVDSKGCF
ncbi:FecR family protein [Dyadobacter jiangsuensis]|uniref:FecR family protein n=1 Tax=Dyadobacter jiangsuensis TaxID=1591085 RepID=A0A2P8GBR2_9BACT|nr:FecR family protein [Dyadobacter jiangsuensis]PSL31411.1 FecR family protein [Dyadobacter jiangsuensis]